MPFAHIQARWSRVPSSARRTRPQPGVSRTPMREALIAGIGLVTHTSFIS